MVLYTSDAAETAYKQGLLGITLHEGKPDHAEDLSEKADVYAHVDSGAMCSASKPSFEDLIQALEEREGKLEVPERLTGAKVV
jgi:hypothetical protein